MYSQVPSYKHLFLFFSTFTPVFCLHNTLYWLQSSDSGRSLRHCSVKSLWYAQTKIYISACIGNTHTYWDFFKCGTFWILLEILMFVDLLEQEPAAFFKEQAKVMWAVPRVSHCLKPDCLLCDILRPFNLSLSATGHCFCNGQQWIWQKRAARQHAPRGASVLASCLPCTTDFPTTTIECHCMPLICFNRPHQTTAG